MAAVSVTNSNNRLTDADATTGWASDGGGGAGPQNEPDFGYQLTSGSNWSVSRKVGTTKGGHAYTHGSQIDMTAEANQVVMCKGVWSNSINSAAYPACGFKVGNDSSNYYEYAVIDDGGQGDLDPDPKQLARIVPIDPNVGAWPDLVTGTTTITQIDFFGIQGDFGGSAKAENVTMDAIDLVRGVGVLWLVGGDGVDADGVFDDFTSHDEGTVSNRFGHVSTVRPGVLEVFGTLWLGRTETPTATATVFQDSALTILFGAGFFDAGWTGIGIDLGSATTDVDFTDIVFKGQGQNDHKAYFDTITDVDPTPDEVTLSPAPGYITAVPVTYNNDGGSDSIGLTSGNVYWLERVTDTTFNVHSSRDNARTAATPIALSDGSTGEAHWFQRTPDIRPDLTVVSTSGAFDATRCTFDSFRQLVLTSGATFTSCVFRSCGTVDMSTNTGGSLQECSFSGQTTEPGSALVVTNTTENIDNCIFTLSGNEAGHAIEVDTAGSYNLDGNILSGYWSSPDNENGATFDTTDAVGVDSTGNDITTTGNHGFSTGDEVWYNDNGGTDTIGLTDGNRYYVNVISATNFSLHRSKENANSDTNRVNLNNTGTGETHTFYSGKAAVVNTSGGAVTLTVGNSGTTPSVRNVGAATTTLVLNPVTTQITVKDPDGNNLQNARVLVEAGDGAGDLPYLETVSITASATLATVSHTAHGLSTGDKVVIRNAAEQDYNGVWQITVTGDNSYTYTMGGSPSSPATIASGKSAITSNGVVVEGLTNASGIVSASRSFSVDQNVSGKIRRSTSMPYYDAIDFTDVVDNANGLTLTRQMVLDE